MPKCLLPVVFGAELLRVWRWFTRTTRTRFLSRVLANLTANNWLATVAGFFAFLTALFNYMKQRRIDRHIRSTAYYSKGRFDDILAENRTLREENTLLKERSNDAGNS